MNKILKYSKLRRRVGTLDSALPGLLDVLKFRTNRSVQNFTVDLMESREIVLCLLFFTSRNFGVPEHALAIYIVINLG